jgi:hypothetical protein
VNLVNKQGTDAQPLPDHLAALVERECDDVLVPAIVQRAYNLAWNRPSAEKTIVDPSMDGVVEDSAICSPLDALAAWYSSFVLAKALTSSLAAKASSPKEDVVSNLDLAIQSAPPNSQSQLRALVAHAVVLDENRDKHIVAALDALPPAPSAHSTGLMCRLLSMFAKHLRSPNACPSPPRHHSMPDDAPSSLSTTHTSQRPQPHCSPSSQRTKS